MAVLRAGAGVPTNAAGVSAQRGVPGALPTATLRDPDRARSAPVSSTRGLGACASPELPCPGPAPHAQCRLCLPLGLLKGTLRPCGMGPL